MTIKIARLASAILPYLLLTVLILAVTVSASEDQMGKLDEADMMAGFPGGKMPTAEELLAVLDSMSMPDDEKETLRQELMKNLKNAGGKAAEADELGGGDGAGHITGSIFASQFFMLIAMLSFVALIFVFFGYKLYKSLTERERKREEKKKSRQMKKKK